MFMKNIQDLRKDYTLASLTSETIDKDAIKQFKVWFQEALDAKVEEPNAMILSTIKKNGMPSARVVLIKGIQEDGFEFFTNYQSNKAKEIADNAKASLLFFWPALERQIRIEGTVEKCSSERSDEYFESRPEGSKLGAWSSPQSQIIESRALLENMVEETNKKFKEQEINRPYFWGGYLVKPTSIEFWQGRASRLHDRLLYTKEQEKWKIERLAP